MINFTKHRLPYVLPENASNHRRRRKNRGKSCVGRVYRGKGKHQAVSGPCTALFHDKHYQATSTYCPVCMPTLQITGGRIEENQVLGRFIDSTESNTWSRALFRDKIYPAPSTSDPAYQHFKIQKEEEQTTHVLGRFIEAKESNRRSRGHAQRYFVINCTRHPLPFVLPAF